MTKLEKVEDLTFTYIGGGADAPYSCNFMGKQEFIKGEPVKIDGTKSHLIMKLRGNPCFVEGEADPKEIAKAEKKAKEESIEKEKKLKQREHEILRKRKKI